MTDKKPTCEYYELCPFFQSTLEDMPSTANLLKTNFCYSAFQSCARYVVTQEVGAEHVTDFLYPNNAKSAQEIIQTVRQEKS
ncbi:hypothetical protein [Endozoicomonas euniceicola]|uniref:Uncharacterized protein n=1 Tax=Endozoicomonas euniceicola TaxID=1234143 RepID=A0ABY6GWG1_9GAMM|nr:hypothetical protein [Endozoicomonas euniceicola]UYM17106.1 hypothetical protein NX720_04055 [Endozoicomonas euniceicola]